MASVTHEVVTEGSEVGSAELESIHDISAGFNVVITVSKKGEVADLKVYEPIKAFDPEVVAKASAFIAGIASFLASQLREGGVREIDLVMNDKLVVMICDEDKIKVGISALT